jgi:hypothetical protein
MNLSFALFQTRFGRIDGSLRIFALGVIFLVGVARVFLVAGSSV